MYDKCEKKERPIPTDTHTPVNLRSPHDLPKLRLQAT